MPPRHLPKCTCISLCQCCLHQRFLHDLHRHLRISQPYLGMLRSSMGPNIGVRSASATPSYPSRPDVRCYGCNEWGHYKSACPKSRRSGYVDYILSSTSHEDELKPVYKVVSSVKGVDVNTGDNMWKLDGAYFEASIDGNHILAYADTGAGVSLINPSVICCERAVQLQQPLRL